MVLDSPVTGRYFRIYHRAIYDNYLSLTELEFAPATFQTEISVSVEPDDYTNMWAAISWSIPESGQCVSGVVERAISPEGPFAQVSDWSEDVGNAKHVDKTSPIGVKYYYRVKAHCIGGGIAGYVYSKVVSYVRSYRLERNLDDLSILKQGVNVIYPYRYMGITYAGSLTQAKNAFDGMTTTYMEYSFNLTGDPKKYCNAAVGVDLGSKYHIAYSYVYPRESPYSTIHDRAGNMAIFGANSVDCSDRVQLSGKLGGFADNVWQYNATTNTVDTFRYVFLYSPDDFETYGNVGEVGFYGFTDQDIIDSGILIPPENVVATAKNTAVALSWSKAWNHGSYAIDRRREGEEEWVRIASGLGAEDLCYLDDDSSVRKGVYEYRVLAVAGENEVSSARVRCAYSPKRGLVIVVQ